MKKNTEHNFLRKNGQNFGFWKQGETSDIHGPYNYYYYITIHGSAFIAYKDSSFKVTCDLNNGYKFTTIEKDLDRAKKFVEKKLGKGQE